MNKGSNLSVLAIFGLVRPFITLQLCGNQEPSRENPFLSPRKSKHPYLD